MGEQTTEKKCLDHGFVRLVDVMGDDSSVVQAARVSYGKGTKTLREDEGLIRYLMRHGHTTPFEMVEFKFHCKMPIFVARQWIRHRTANVNEVSGRYSEMRDEFYVPDAGHVTKQNPSNKQGGTDEPVVNADAEASSFHVEARSVFEAYSGRLATGMRKELARINLPLSTYTEWYWKIDLHNLFHFLRLRLDSHAQYEIRVYAEAMAEVVRERCPLSWQAFEDYRLNSVTLSGREVRMLRSILGMNGAPKLARIDTWPSPDPGKREMDEFCDKLRQLGWTVE